MILGTESLESLLADWKRTTDETGGFTRLDIEQRLGCSRGAAGHYLNLLIRAGTVRYIGDKRTQNSAGRFSSTPSYEVVKRKKRK